MLHNSSVKNVIHISFLALKENRILELSIRRLLVEW